MNIQKCLYKVYQSDGIYGIEFKKKECIPYANEEEQIRIDYVVIQVTGSVFLVKFQIRNKQMNCIRENKHTKEDNTIIQEPYEEVYRRT